MKFLRNSSSHRIWLLPVMLLLLVSTQAFARGYEREVEVTITNITKGQILSPAVVVAHKPGLTPLFTLGEPASMELAGVAEDADIQPLIDSLNADPRVIEVGALTGAGGPILPGETASLTLSAGYNFTANRISLVGMLVTTNDAFYGLNAATAPAWSFRGKYGKKEMYLVPAYDSGTEFNSESCAFIPGPPCMNHQHDPTVAEGYVYIHNGIHGAGDLLPEEYDWHNPVARITIRLVRQPR